jgi:hypothetical protein
MAFFVLLCHVMLLFWDASLVDRHQSSCKPCILAPPLRCVGRQGCGRTPLLLHGHTWAMFNCSRSGLRVFLVPSFCHCLDREASIAYVDWWSAVCRPSPFTGTPPHTLWCGPALVAGSVCCVPLSCQVPAPVCHNRVCAALASVRIGPVNVF